jgi:hypothetical protein
VNAADDVLDHVKVALAAIHMHLAAFYSTFSRTVLFHYTSQSAESSSRLVPLTPQNPLSRRIFGPLHKQKHAKSLSKIERVRLTDGDNGRHISRNKTLSRLPADPIRGFEPGGNQARKA